MEKLTVTLKTVTPLFLGGAEPNERAELRAPSIKGAMRFWYRAIDADYVKNEPKIFGSTDEGQGGFFLRTGKDIKEPQEWNPTHYDKLTIKHPNYDANKGHNEKTWQLNGIKYLSYSLKLGDKKPKFIPTDKDIKLLFTLRPNAHPDCKKALLSSLWLLGHIGGLGSRSRRGFGTVALQSWEWEDKSTIELPIAHSADSPEKWLEQFQKGLNMIKDWFKGERVVDHTVFGSNTKFYLLNGFPIETRGGKPFEPWEMALNEAGLRMQTFRQRYKPDYDNVRNHLIAKAGNGGVFLKEAPQRTAFGLPLTFQYSKLPTNSNKTIFQGHPYERNASPLHIRIVKIGDVCNPLFILLDAPLIAVKEQKDKEGQNAKKPPTPNILNTFCDTVLKEKTVGTKEGKVA